MPILVVHLTPMRIRSHYAAVGIFLVAVLGLASVRIPHADAAFGISPPFINADKLVPGSKYVQTIYLVQDQPNEDLRIRTQIELDETIKNWITVQPSVEFTIPQGQRQFPVTIAITVPKNASLGVYSGTMSFVGAPGSAGQVTIALGAQVQLNLSIGNDIYRKFSVPIVRPLDIETGWNPRVQIKFNNEGNIPEAFDAATFLLTDKFDAVRLAYVQKAKDFPKTPPFTSQEYILEFPIDFHIGIGEYWGSVQLYQNEQVVAGQKAPFNVLAQGSLASTSAKFWNALRQAWIPLLVVAALSAGVYLKRKKALKRKHS